MDLKRILGIDKVPLLLDYDSNHTRAGFSAGFHVTCVLKNLPV